jgi:PAS domain S-box-containing protein
VAEQDPQWPPGSSAAGTFIRAMDWSASSLGTIPEWHPSLRIAVSNALDSPVATIVLWGADLIQIYNDSYQVILGARHPKAMGQPTRECWSDVWHFNQPIYAKIMETGESFHFEDQEFVLGPPDQGVAFYFTVTYFPLRDNIGHIRGVIVRVVETTAQVMLKRMNIELADIADRGSKRQSFNLRLADALRSVNGADDAIANASEILGQQLGACRVLYCEVDDPHGTFEIRRDWTRADVPSVAGPTRLLAEFGDEIIDSLRCGKVVVVADVASDARTTDARAGYAGIGVKSFLAMPLLTDGQLSVVLAVHRTDPYGWNDAEVELTSDVIERTWAAAENAKAQATMRLERDRCQAVFDGMMEGFALIDCNDFVLQMNDAGLRLAQRDAAEVIGHHHWDVWPDTEHSSLARLYAAVMETGIAGSFEYEQAFPNGASTWLEIRAYRTSSLGLAIFYRDIGERKLAQAALTDASQRKDEFLAMLAHELRNPLSPISAAASLLLRGRHEEHLVKRASEIIARQVRHMSSLIDDLLDVSRVTRGIIDLDKTTLDMKQVVGDAVEQVQPLIELLHHRLVLNLPAETTFVMGDHKRMVQVLTNLLNNAAKYTADGGEIFITMGVRDADVVLVIRDTGIGMAPELLQRAFQLFAQETRTSDRSQGGLGLGLALVKSLVELHGGTVKAHSAGRGFGSEFTVALPQVVAADKSPIRELPDRADVQTSPLRILVVDDNADATNTLALLLSTMGHAVTVEFSGVKALRRVRAEYFDACLLDIGLPDINGYELGKFIKADSQSMDATLIAITGYGLKQDMLDSAAAGFDHHLVKPVDTTTLMHILDGLVARPYGENR